MASCHHTTLELLPQPKSRLRCRQCHLTIDREELVEGYCPECFEISGSKQYEFEEMESAGQGFVRYRCDQCGAIIKSA